MPKLDESDRAADLLERLLTDARFRAAFRRDPAAAARKYELNDLADELSQKGRASETLEIRESRSSLAGVLMAAAAEGFDASDLSASAGAGRLEAPAQVAVTRALSRVNLPAVSPTEVAGSGAGGGVADGLGDGQASSAPELHQEFAGLSGQDAGPTAHGTFGHLAAVEEGQPQAHAPAEVVEPAATPAQSDGAAVAVDPSTAVPGASVGFPGGAAGNQALVDALLKDPNVTVPPDVQQELLSGAVDSRVPALLEALSAQGHKLELSAIDPGHNGFDVSAVNGNPVDAANMDARDVATALTTLDPAIRPTHVDSPWPIDDPAFFSDAEHQSVLHVAWTDPLPAGWTPPADVTAIPGVAAAAQTASGAAPGAAAAESAAAGAPTPAPPPVVDPTATPAAPVSPAQAHAAHDEFGAVRLTSDDKASASVGAQTFSQLASVREASHAVQPQAVAGAVDGTASPAGVHVVGDFLPDGSDTYPGDGATKEQIAAWMGRQAHKAGLPAELPVMAGLVESGFQNVQHGDADSLGYFQMRVSVWDKGSYAGFAHQPDLQLKWFIHQALEVKRERLAAGRGPELQDPSKFGDWVADVERPAAEYRGRYQLRLADAQSLLHDGGQATPPSAAAFVTPPAVPAGQAIQIAPGHAGGVLGDAISATAPVPVGAGLQSMTIDGVHATGSPVALRALENAFRYKGTPYHWGGNTEQTGFDCSGLMQWSYHQSGIDISRVTYTQVHDGVEVADRNQLEAGDLILFRDSSGDIHHVGMYVGDHKFIHAPHTGDVVKVSDLREPYYAQQFYMGRRIAPVDASAAVASPPLAPVAAVAPPSPELAVAPPDGSGAPAGHDEFAAIPKLGGDAGPPRVRSTVQFLRAVAQPEPASGPAVAQAAEQVSAQPSAAGALDPAAAAELAASGYPGDGATKEQIAAWMAAQAEARGLPRELPVMAALVESGLRNVSYGDADSLGYFQMRASIWGQGAYAGFAHRPDLQVKWFLDHAEAVKQERLAQGDSSFANDPSKWGDWIADVERPAEHYRDRYQLRLDEARQLLGG